MRFSNLQIFVDVVEAGGMTQAAAAKDVSQPGISRVIRELETQAGAPLLRRTGRGVELTMEGSAFLAFAQESLSAYDAMIAQIRQMAGALPPTITLAVPRRVGEFLFPEIYRHFLATLPELTISTSELLSQEISDGLAAGRIDLALSYLSATPSSGEAIALFQEDLYLVGRAATIGPNDRPIALADVMRYPVLLNSPQNRYRRHIDSIALSAGYKLIVTREIETAEGLLAFAMEGEGVTILPFSNALKEVARGDIAARPIVTPAISRTIYLHTARHLDRHSITRLIETLLPCVRTAAPVMRWRPFKA